MKSLVLILLIGFTLPVHASPADPLIQNYQEQIKQIQRLIGMSLLTEQPGLQQKILQLEAAIMKRQEKLEKEQAREQQQHLKQEEIALAQEQDRQHDIASLRLESTTLQSQMQLAQTELERRQEYYNQMLLEYDLGLRDVTEVNGASLQVSQQQVTLQQLTSQYHQTTLKLQQLL